MTFSISFRAASCTLGLNKAGPFSRRLAPFVRFPVSQKALSLQLSRVRRRDRCHAADSHDAIPQAEELHSATSPFEEAFAFSPWRECQALMKVSSPAFFQGLLGFSLTSIIFLFVGRLGSLPLSVASLALSFFYLTGASIACGMAMGIETIGGQAHGAGNSRVVSLVFLQGLALSVTACAVISLAWTRAEWIFLKLGQDPVVSKKAALYMQLLIPHLCLEALITTRSKSLASRGIVRPTTASCACALLVAPLLCWILVFKTKLGMYGAPVTLCISTAIPYALLTYWTRSEKFFAPENVTHLCQAGWVSLRKYISVTLPGLATICSEWWTYEMFTVLAGLLASPQLSLGVMGASNCIINILFVLAMALCAGVLVRVSNLLGAGKKHAAIASARTTVVVTVLVESLSLLAICFFAQPISRIWFTDAVSGHMFVSVLPLISLTEWGSGMSFVLGGILRACNRGKFEFLANFSCYWFVGLPLGVILGFPCQMGVMGFWIGLATAANLQFIILAIVTCRLDFDLEIKRAQKLAQP